MTYKGGIALLHKILTHSMKQFHNQTFLELQKKYRTAFNGFLLGEFPIAVYIVNTQTPITVRKCGE